VEKTNSDSFHYGIVPPTTITSIYRIISSSNSTSTVPETPVKTIHAQTEIKSVYVSSEILHTIPSISVLVLQDESDVKSNQVNHGSITEY
jgi:hypothetical protein